MIFNLFKSKPTLKELIPKGFVDIHSHILPGIDDGAKNIEESLSLIKEMKKMGFSKIIGTPHSLPGLYDNTTESIKRSFEILEKELLEEIIIEHASEYMLENSLINKVRKKDILCISENYILVEMSYLAEPINLFEIIYEINVNGYIPVLAHPERYLFLYNDIEKYIKLKKVGCLFQANLLSLTNYYGVNVRKLIDKLLKRNLIDCFGSDIHSHRHIKGFDKKVDIKDIKQIQKLFDKNKFNIINH